MTLRLAAAEYGAGPTVAVLHGLFGWGRNWATIAQRLAVNHRVVTVDLRNHGNSPWADTMSYAEMAMDLRDTLGGEPASVVGHSMGGKVAMAAALTGEWVERLVVVDIAPALYPPPLAELAAMQGLNLAAVTRRADADRALGAKIVEPAERAFLLQNLVFDGGKASWRLNLDGIGAAMPEICGFPEFDAAYSGPTLFVAGDRSDYLRPEHELAIRRLFPAAEFTRIADAGHWLHAEQPEAFLRVVADFLAD